ncbi:MAG: hypothetical protein ABF258_03955 [Flavobacteriales bacterium]
MGGRFGGYNNQLFDKIIRFDLKSRTRSGSNENLYKFFDYKIVKGIPTEFVNYQDTNNIDSKIIFKNGLIDSIKSYYSNGNLMFEATLENGKLNGDFVYWDEDGNEKLRVLFRENEIQHFYFRETKYEWQEILRMWIQPHTPHK